uniref:exodeoxyribonuclease III n=1 Tax=Anolis carolinensis TaxID=28377 RepID=H9GU51_ANOCA
KLWPGNKNISLSCYSSNVNGLNSPSKRKSLFNKLRKGKYSVIALQETHIDQNHTKYLENTQLGKVFVSADVQKKRGVALYIDCNIKAEEQFKDKEGRVIAARLDTEGGKTLVVNIYAPNGPKFKFIKGLKDNINKTEFDHLILFGDFNGVVDKMMDKTFKTKNSKAASSLPKNFLALMEEYDLVDAWREYNRDVKDYTFYSNRHQAWSRIDMIWCSRSILVKINKIQILARDLSDHCPLILEINRRYTTRKWRLDGNLIKQEEDIIKIKAMTKEYFKLNNTAGMKPQIVWDAYKAVARGFLIKLKAEKRKQKEALWNKLIKDIETKEKELKANPKNLKTKRGLELLVRQKKSWELD